MPHLPCLCLLLAAACGLVSAEPAAILPAPASYFRCDDVAEGTVRDSASARRHAGLRGPVQAAAGVVGGAVHCDGATAYLAGRWPQPAGASSYEAWLRLAVLPAQPVVVVGRPDGRCGLLLRAGGAPCFTLATADGTLVSAVAATALRVGPWAHLVGVCDPAAGRLRLLVDGVVAGEMAFAGVPGPSDPHLRIGGDGVHGISGLLDEVRLWDRALDAAQIAVLLAAGRAGRSPFPELQPDASFSPESAPRETVPPLSAELVARIAGQPVAAAQLVTGSDGRTRFQLGDHAVSLLGGQQMQAQYARDILHLAPYREGGMELISVAVNAGFFHPDAGYRPLDEQHPPFWEGAGRYRPEGLEPDLWRALRSHPDATLLVWIWLASYPAFANEHPDARICNLRGDPLIATTHFLRFDAQGPSPDPALHEQYAISFHSPEFVAAAAAMCAELVRVVERTVPGRKVAGYLIGGGQDGQLYDWNPPNHRLVRDPLAWGDFSPAARAAWGRWLADTYGDAAAVARAWGRPVATLDPAPVPTAEDLVGAATLHHPLSGRIAIDWNRFSVAGRTTLLSRLAAAIKGAATRPTLVGVCAGDAAARKDEAQVAELLTDPQIDFHLHQPTYNQRQPGLIGGLNASLGSLALHHKLFFADVDHPTWLVADGQSGSIGEVHQDSRSRGRAADLPMLQAMWRRELGWLSGVGQGALIHPILGGPWMYRDPQVVGEFSALQRLFTPARSVTPVVLPGVATICDERAVAFLKGGLANLEWAWFRGQQDELIASGAPGAGFYADDLRNGLLPPVPLMICNNLLQLDPALVTGLRRLQGGGRTQVFLQGTGWEQQATGHAAEADAALGIRLRPLSQPPVDQPPVDQPPVGQPSSAVAAALDPAEVPLMDLEWAAVDSAGHRGPALLAADPPATGPWQPLARATCDGTALLGGAPGEDRALRWRGTFTLDRPTTVALSVFADWWFTATIDGHPVLAVERTAGGSATRLVSASCALSAGPHRIAALLVSGSAGFRASLALHRGARPPAERSQVLDPDPQAGLWIDDSRARISAWYPDGRPAVGEVDHGDWRAVFVGTWTLGRELLAQYAAAAGAWCVCPPGLAVVHAGPDQLTVHALVDGDLPLTFPRAIALEEIPDAGLRLPAATVQHLTLRRGETRVFRLLAEPGH